MAKESKKSESKEVARTEGRTMRALTPFDEMERLMEQVLGRGLARRWFEFPRLSELHLPLEGKVPPVDVIDRDDEIVVKAELPGVDKKDLEISVAEDSLTLRATTSEEHKEGKGDFVRQEIRRGSVSRIVALPAVVDPDKAKASFKDGILEVVLPKASRARRRTIEVE